MKDVKRIEGTEYIIDKILFASNYPILFTCVDGKQELYICVCCQNNIKGKKWLLTKTTPRLVVSMLRDQIAIRDVFLRFPDSRITVFADQNNIVLRNNADEDWEEDSIYLPQAGEYMEAEVGEFEEEIAYYNQMNEKYYNSRSFILKVAK